MFTSFRSFFKSKIGIAVTLVFLAVIAIAFASADVSNSGTFGGIGGGDNVAVVGDKKITTAELRQAANAQVDQMRQQNPTITMAEFLKQDGLTKVLDSMINRYAVSEYAKEHGLRAGENLVNSEIIQIPAFKGPDGKFDQERYEQILQQRGLTDQVVRADFADGLLAQQVLYPASYGTFAPDKFITHYGALLRERRSGEITLLPSGKYAPKAEPSDQQIADYYKKNMAKYTRPERRVIRYVTFDDSAVGGKAEPTDAQIAAKYNANKAKYGARQERSYTQLIVPTQAAAKSIAQKVASGGSLSGAAKEAGLETSSVGPATKAQITEQSSPAVANAVFSTGAGKTAAPVKSGLGWHVIQVDKVNSVPARSLAQARDEIAAELRVENQRKAISDLAARIEEQVDGGASLSELAKQVGGQVEETPQITANGQVYGTDKGANQSLAPIIKAAFQMPGEGEPQLATTPDGNRFIIFEAGEIIPQAAAPLKDVRQQVVADWQNTQGFDKASKVADRVIASLSKGVPIAKALADADASGAPVQNVSMTREELLRSQQQVPAPISLMFQMAQGTAKKLKAPNDYGWVIVNLDSITPGSIKKDDPMFAQTRTQLAQTLSGEYAEQLQKAILKSMTVKRNPSAIDAVKRQLSGES